MMTREEILSIEEYCIEHNVYSLFSCCKAHDIDDRTWLVDILKRIPTEKDINQLLPGNWKVLPANSR